MHRHQITLHPDDIQTARLVILNPDSFHDDPGARLDAWAALKAQRGQQVNPLRLHLLQRAYQHPASLPVRVIRPCTEAAFFDGMQA